MKKEINNGCKTDKKGKVKSVEMPMKKMPIEKPSAPPCKTPKKGK